MTTQANATYSLGSLVRNISPVLGLATFVAGMGLLVYSYTIEPIYPMEHVQQVVDTTKKSLQRLQLQLEVPESIELPSKTTEVNNYLATKKKQSSTGLEEAISSVETEVRKLKTDPVLAEYKKGLQSFDQYNNLGALLAMIGLMTISISALISVLYTHRK